MNQIIKNIALALPILLWVGCGSDLEQPASNEEVVGGELAVNFSAEQMKKMLIAKEMVDANQTVFGYKAYKIPYTTTNEQGEEVDVSGLFVIPTGVPEIMNTLGFSMVSDDHGTIFANIEAPSVIGTIYGTPDPSGDPAILLTSLGGFATLRPDYIGFGDSLGEYHPFVQKESLANASIDFIKAVKVFSAKNDIKLNNQLFVTGYSEGGYAAMATLQKIEEEGELTVAMAAPMAGPYDLNITAFGVLAEDNLSVPSFMADVGYAYGKTYNKELSTIINEPYASKLPTLLNGSLSRAAIDGNLTTQTKGDGGLFTAAFAYGFLTDPNHWFRQAVLENSVHAWTPTTPVRLIHCQGDEVIPYLIAQKTEATMNALGATNVTIVPVEATLGLSENLGHAECGLKAYQIATQLFATARGY